MHFNEGYEYYNQGNVYELRKKMVGNEIYFVNMAYVRAIICFSG